MRFITEYRDARMIRQLSDEIAQRAGSAISIMEICGGQTHAIIRYGLDQLLEGSVSFIHGPGCPVCVTPQEMIDASIEIAMLPDVVFTSFGDMLRVPGSRHDLLSAKAQGADIRIVYSPVDAVKLAREHTARQIVFFAVGFETTAPTVASAIQLARRNGIQNFSVICAHVRVPPALELLLASDDSCIDAVLAAGHVCTVMGFHEYEPIALRYNTPIVVTGFEPADILRGCLTALKQHNAHNGIVANEYARVVRRDGNPHAQALLASIFKVVDRNWRGIGVIPSSGYAVADDYSEFDALRRFRVGTMMTPVEVACIAGEVLQGKKKPDACPSYKSLCSPDTPLGAPMVSPEGACAAYFRYKR